MLRRNHNLARSHFVGVVFWSVVNTDGKASLSLAIQSALSLAIIVITASRRGARYCVISRVRLSVCLSARIYHETACQNLTKISVNVTYNFISPLM